MMDEGESDQGHMLLFGGQIDGGPSASTAVCKVDLATGVCTAQPSLLCPEGHVIADCTAGRLPDGRIVCVGTTCFLDDESLLDVDDWEEIYHTTVQVLEPTPNDSSGEASWSWRVLPGTNELRYSGRGCVLSDGRFAIFGGDSTEGFYASSCEALTLNVDGGHWNELPPMRAARCRFACAAIGGCVIVAGTIDSMTTEVYEEELGLWRLLPCSLPNHGVFFVLGSALL
jgi:hypothetical protein